MCNNDIRTEAKAAKVKLWQIADALGLYDTNFSKMLRKELPPEEKTKIRQIISELKVGEAHGENAHN